MNIYNLNYSLVKDNKVKFKSMQVHTNEDEGILHIIYINNYTTIILFCVIEFNLSSVNYVQKKYIIIF